MFNTPHLQTHLSATLYLAVLIYHASVRKAREKYGNAVISILIAVGQTAMFALAFYVMFAILPICAPTIRGDFFLYTM